MEESEFAPAPLTTEERMVWYIEVALVKLAPRERSPSARPPLVNRRAVCMAVRNAVDPVLDPAGYAHHSAWLACVVQLRGDLVDREPARPVAQFDRFGVSYRQAVAWTAALFLAETLTDTSYDPFAGPLHQVGQILHALDTAELETAAAATALEALLPQFTTPATTPADAPVRHGLARLATTPAADTHRPAATAGSRARPDTEANSGTEASSGTEVSSERPGTEPTRRGRGVGGAIVAAYHDTPVLTRMVVLVLMLAGCFATGLWVGATFL